MIRNTFEWDTIISDMSPNPDAPIDYVDPCTVRASDLSILVAMIDTETRRRSVPCRLAGPTA